MSCNLLKSKLSEKKFREILKYFCFDETANKTSIYTKISRNTINKIYDKIRQKIFLAHIRQEEKSFGEFELDESYFGAKRIRGKRIRGKRGRGAVEKTPVFGLLKRDGKVFVEIVKNCTREQLMSIIQANYSGKNS